MAQLSRPYQIALLALATLVLVWFVALHRPGAGSTSSPSPSVSSSAGGSSPSSASGSSSAGGSSSSSASGTSSAGTPSSVYHGSAPGVEGLTKDINKAHGAVAASEHNARELHSKSAQASGEATGGAASTSTATASVSKAPATVPQRSSRAQHGSAAAAPSNSAAAIQSTVAAELKQGKVVLLLFWNPRSTDDAAVERQLQAAAHKLGRGVAVHTAGAKQVNSFGSITRNIQVYQTPTLLIVDPKLQVTALTGYTDAYSIEQAVAEARG